MACPLCNDTGDQRYWEGRWRDADTENAKLRAALKEIADHKSIMSDWPHTTGAMQRIARAALKE